MTKLIKVAGIGLATIISLAIQSSAQALDFSFEFDDGINSVSGTIFGLTEGTSTPTSVIASSTFLGWNNLELTDPLGTFPQTFSVFGGEIIDDNYVAQDKMVTCYLYLMEINP